MEAAPGRAALGSGHTSGGATWLPCWAWISIQSWYWDTSG